MNTIRIDFSRAADFASHRGIVARGTDAFFDLCRLLADRGWRGPVDGFDELGVPYWTARDVAACARRYRPNEADRVAQEGRRKERAVAAIQASAT